MFDSRLLMAGMGLVIGLVISVVAWYYWNTLLLFLFLPFIPFFFWRPGRSTEPERRSVRTCPTCGFRTTDPEFEYCPRDGRRMIDDSPGDGRTGVHSDSG